MKDLAKRSLDIFAALLVMLVLSPVLFVVAVAIKLTSKGPVIFKQQRVGKNGRPFMFYKFRTMRSNVDPFGPSPKSNNDPRLTKVGKFLREYLLDELPQLFNVLKGDVSIVGLRPLYLSRVSEWSRQ
jgi:lipopolysaccharide/colanic/teichoic acid biosynthesis glycosyltransferase